MVFWKMQGCGNDFIIIDGRFDGRDGNSYSEDAKRYCSRKFSIGADGFIIVKESKLSDIQMVYYNSDGSRAAMCGNGIRCFSKYVVDNGIILNKDSFNVETLNGIQEIKVFKDDNNKVKSVLVGMGEFCFKTRNIPVKTDEDLFIEKTIIANGKAFKVSSVLLGVPHTIVFVDEELSVKEIESYGRAIENHPIFPDKTNVNFVKIIDNKKLLVQTWERGCGYTFGCGTGMASSAVIANYLKKTGNSVTVSSFGGSVEIFIDNKQVFMQGSAEKIYSGEV